MSIALQLGKLSTPLVSDALDRLGVNGGLLGLRALVPGSYCAGSAFTLKFERVRDGESAPAADYIDDVPSGSVIVIDNGGRGDCTVWGDILTQVARARGIAGTVIHGNCRDAARIRELDYPLFSTGVYMKSGKNRVRLTTSNVPVVIGETEVTPGDIVCGDDSGVVVVPAALAPKVLEVAAEIEAMEQRVLSEVSGGMPLRRARELHAYNQYSFRASTEP